MFYYFSEQSAAKRLKMLWEDCLKVSHCIMLQKT